MPQRGYSWRWLKKSVAFPKRKNCFLFQFLISMNPTKGTPTVNCSCGRGCDCSCSCNCACICNCDCILFFLLYYRECYANFRNRECRPESVVRCPYPVSFVVVVVVASCAKVLGTEMKFNWICIGIRLNRLCKHFVSFHLRAFRFLGSLTVNSAMWMCESFPPPFPLLSSTSSSSSHPAARQFVAMSRLQLSPAPSFPSSHSFCVIWFACSSFLPAFPPLFRFSFA